jgi:hypothetical protein
MAEESEFKGLGADILAAYEASESQGSDAGDFGIDFFSNSFEDEFPGDNKDAVGSGTFVGYSPESNRAAENRPWGDFSDRPKVWELNQPEAAQMSGLRIVEFIPRRNRKWVFHRLAGTPTELRVMMQTVQATRQATGANVDFDQWFDLWRNGFLDFTENRTTGNFQITGENQWNRLKDTELRPKWQEWTSSFQRADLGFRAGQYWPDASQENISFPVSGTDLQCIAQVMQIEHVQLKISRGTIKEGGGSSGFKGLPKIKLYFLAANGDESETSFRITTKTDDPKNPLPKIDKSDLRLYAQRIKEQFATPSLFNWEKGQKILSYNNSYQGFNGQWWLCKDESAGRALLTKLLAVSGVTLDISRLRIGTAVDEASAFPANPPNITVLGESVPQNKERPLVDATFSRAEIILSKLKNPIPLVERGRVLYE